MKDKDSVQLPEGLGYTTRHMWCRKDGALLIVGLTDFAQDQLGEVLFVDLPDQELIFEADATFGSIESTKNVSQLYMPVTGDVLEINKKLHDTPSLINRDCYGAGWLMRIHPIDENAFLKLLSATAYRNSLT